MFSKTTKIQEWVWLRNSNRLNERREMAKTQDGRLVVRPVDEDCGLLAAERVYIFHASKICQLEHHNPDVSEWLERCW